VLAVKLQTIGEQIAIGNAYKSAMFGNSWCEKFVPVESEFTYDRKLQPMPIPMRMGKHQSPQGTASFLLATNFPALRKIIPHH